MDVKKFFILLCIAVYGNAAGLPNKKPALKQYTEINLLNDQNINNRDVSTPIYYLKF